VKVADSNTNQKRDAVAVYVETKSDNSAYVFYYPYELTNKEHLTFYDSWKELNEKEIFDVR
jgi:hypothetical protein